MGALFGFQCVNTLFFHNTVADVNVFNLTVFVNDLYTNYLPIFLSKLSVDYEARVIVGRRWRPGLVPAASRIATGNFGALSGPSHPGNTAKAITFDNGTTSPHRRNRNFIPAIPRDQTTQNTIKATYAALAIDSYTQLITKPWAPDWQWVTVSQVLNGLPRVLGLRTPVVRVRIVSPTLDQTRRRVRLLSV